MESISNIKIELPKITARSYRESLLKELYQLYISQPEINRKENRRRYHEWMRKYHPTYVKKSTYNEQSYKSYKEDFKKAKLPKGEGYVKYIPESRFWFFFSHVDKDGLEKVLSEAKDIKWREYNVASFIIGQVLDRKK